MASNKQAWFEKFRSVLSFHGSRADNSLFMKYSGDDCVSILVYVDDVVITGSLSIQVEQFKRDLRQAFALKDLGNLSYFLGIEVKQTYHSPSVVTG